MASRRKAKTTERLNYSSAGAVRQRIVNHKRERDELIASFDSRDLLPPLGELVTQEG